MRLRVLTANVNGLRAAARRGGVDWLADQDADVLALQEVRADADQVSEVLAAGPLAHHHLALAASDRPGHAGVALLTRDPAAAVRVGLGGTVYERQGRWVEADVRVGERQVTVVSTYVHTGEAGTGRQVEKETFLGHVGDRFAAWAREGRYAVVTGDLNIAHTDEDLKNWKGNRGKAGCLPSERAHLDRWRDELGAVDVHRALHGPGPGPHTWWSWRGKAFDNDAGWRIDYQLATAPLAGCARSVSVGRAASYAQRWSDHAAVVVDYDLAP